MFRNNFFSTNQFENYTNSLNWKHHFNKALKRKINQKIYRISTQLNHDFIQFFCAKKCFFELQKLWCHAIECLQQCKQFFDVEKIRPWRPKSNCILHNSFQKFSFLYIRKVIFLIWSVFELPGHFSFLSAWFLKVLITCIIPIKQLSGIFYLL